MGMFQDLLQELPHLAEVKARVALAEGMYEQAIKENEELRQRIAVLENENARSFPPSPRRHEISDDAARVLVHLFRAKKPEERAVEAISVALNMERSVLQSHLEVLRDANLAQMTGRNYASGHAYWAPTAEGQRYVVLGINP